ncbi:MAG: formate--tetrahydrofolate ligase, partial [Thermoplasmata archaeon]|nr:formate--tetrahydrofolate ligase [Thermoplasmata archaeon]
MTKRPINPSVIDFSMPLSDIEIAQQTRLRPIAEIAAAAGLLEEEMEFWGHNIAKVSLSAMQRLSSTDPGHLILVTTMNPTPQGEGKTTVTIGLA